MTCPQCQELERVRDQMYAEYIVAFYAGGPDIADLRKEGMERAKTAAEEHRLACPFRPDSGQS